jgi:ubiquitin C-terminal hydrolase
LGELDEQHDSSEFARIFLDKLESELKQSSNLENINKKYLEGSKVHQI